MDWSKFRYGVGIFAICHTFINTLTIIFILFFPSFSESRNLFILIGSTFLNAFFIKFFYKDVLEDVLHIVKSKLNRR